MRGLAVRAEAAEQMDAPDLPAAVLGAVLGDLARVNRWTLAARPTLGFLDRVVERGGRVRLLDVGCGGGDMLRRIAGWARQRGVAAELAGVDLNPNAVAAARAATPAGMQVAYHAGRYEALAGRGWDVVVSSLVAHHMSPPELMAFLRFMEAEARVGWLVNDLHRHLVPYWGFPVLARVAGWHRMVREDGRLSIARAFRPGEWEAVLAAAGMEGVRVRRMFPFRLCVERRR